MSFNSNLINELKNSTQNCGSELGDVYWREKFKQFLDELYRKIRDLESQIDELEDDCRYLKSKIR